MFVKSIIEDRLSTIIHSMTPISGGDINEVYRIESAKGLFIAKINDLDQFPEMFDKEAKGLNLLQLHGVNTPNVVEYFQSEKIQVLILQYIEEGSQNPDFWNQFAEDLAKLHKCSQVQFGLDHDNYIGSLKQKNSFKDTWEEFFITNRIKPLVKIAFDLGRLNQDHLKRFNDFFTVFHELVPSEPPSLLHGDLWSGNLLCSKGQKPVFIDPAVYYGHREIDLSMTQMFGGFNSRYIESYMEIFPLEKGWMERLAIHNLYPNLVHLILFGSSYLGGIEPVIKKYT